MGAFDLSAQSDALSETARLQHAQLINRNAPVSSLPGELLIAIFETSKNCAQEPPTFHGNVELTLSHVTRHWRRVAINAPSLWMKIRPWFGLSLVALYLERSQSCPMDIQLECGWSYDNDMAILDAVVAHVDRCRRLEMSGRTQEDIYMALSRFQYSTAPSLRSIHIDLPTATELPAESSHPIRYIFMGGAPLLSTLTMHGIAQSSCWPPLTLLRTLEIDGLDVNDLFAFDLFHDFLLGSKALTELSLDGEIVRNWPVGNLVPINLPLLRKLRIYDTKQGTSRFSLLMAIISAPALESLELGYIWEDGFISFLNSSPVIPKFPVLRSLILEDHGLTEAQFTDFARAFPNITHLTVPADTHRELLPLLSILKLRSSSASRVLWWPCVDDITVQWLENWGAVSLCKMEISKAILVGRPRNIRWSFK